MSQIRVVAASVTSRGQRIAGSWPGTAAAIPTGRPRLTVVGSGPPHGGAGLLAAYTQARRYGRTARTVMISLKSMPSTCQA